MAFKLVVFCCCLAFACAEPIPYLGINNLLEGRIVGGSDAQRGEFPHQVSLQWGYSEGNAKHFCGGTILNARWILTAGHCVNAVPGYGVFAVKAGKHLIGSRNEPTEQSAVVAKSYVHPQYPGNVAPYDIALLKLKKPLKLNSDVASISLPKANSLPKGDVILSGWGSTSKTSFPTYPDTLQKITLPIVDLKTCRESIEKLTGPAPLADTNVCTGPLSGGYSACSGDSGGPLIVQDETTGNREVIGIVSWGIVPCGTRGAPSVYTRVSAYIDWIKDIMGDKI